MYKCQNFTQPATFFTWCGPFTVYFLVVYTKLSISDAWRLSVVLMKVKSLSDAFPIEKRSFEVFFLHSRRHARLRKGCEAVIKLVAALAESFITLAIRSRVYVCR
jgi:hypothetical protein